MLPIASVGEVDKQRRHQLADTLVAGLRRGGLTIVPPGDVYRAYPDSIEACDSLACYAEVTRATQTTHTVRAEITVDGEGYRFALEAYDVEHERIAATAARACPGCSSADATQLLADLGEELARGVTKSAPGSSGTAILRIDSEPAGATVILDDAEVGTTPLQLEVGAGSHRVRVLEDGYQAKSHELVLAEGEREEYSVHLVALASERRSSLRGRASRRDRPRKPIPAWPGGLLLGTGLGAVAAGVVLIVLDERPIRSRCTGDDVDRFGNCRYRHDTLPLGVGLAAGGAALAVVGVTLLAVSRHRARRPRAARLAPARLAPAPQGLAIRF
ncbi:MAG: PEGA domain-containing protein [Myxococcales bacterium]|nr:PEGA domain-containing protein [Myxococcales bacterium]